jgi:hypothetical protein
MTDDERRAFAAGYRVGVEHAIEAHDDLLTLAAEHACICSWYADEVPERERVATRAHRRIWVAVLRIRRLRERGAEQVLTLHDIEQTMAAER